MAIAAVFQIGSLGDTIVSVPSLLSIRELLPDCSEYILLSQSKSKLTVSPNRIFDMAWKAKRELRYRGPKNGYSNRSLSSMMSLAGLLAKLHYYRPKYCVYLMPAERAAWQVERDIKFFRASPIRNLVGFRPVTDAERIAAQGPNIRSTEAFLRFRRLWNEHAEAKFAEYSRPPLFNPGPDADAAVDRWLGRRRVAANRPLVALCPYSNSSSRNIPQGTVIEILKRLDSELGVETVILGGMKDNAAAARLVADAGNGLNACGEFSPSESAALLTKCALAVCTDSGPLHLAGALGVPTVTSYSRVNPLLNRWFPLGPNHTILYRNVSCAGCRENACPIPDHPCMTGITADQIIAASAAKLGRGGDSLASVLDGTVVIEWPGIDADFPILHPHRNLREQAHDRADHVLR